MAQVLFGYAIVKVTHRPPLYSPRHRLPRNIKLILPISNRGVSRKKQSQKCFFVFADRRKKKVVLIIFFAFADRGKAVTFAETIVECFSRRFAPTRVSGVPMEVFHTEKMTARSPGILGLDGIRWVSGVCIRGCTSGPFRLTKRRHAGVPKYVINVMQASLNTSI